ncbi:MAG: D-aminoacyl-tRNA deacylase [Candidatus Zixiibacteriota bacterium]
MRLVVQRTSGVEVVIDGKVLSRTGRGLLVLVGSRKGDNEKCSEWLADKVVNLRIFEDDDGKMNLSCLDVAGEIMIVSQFTLYADTRKGRRPAFTEAMEATEAERLYNEFVRLVGASGLKVATGKFGAKMDVRFDNDGPVTIILDYDI